MKLAGKSVAQQQGFTLIELIMVVVILGVLSAFALPRFGNFRADAQLRAAQAARAAVQNASDMVHGQAIIAGTTGAAAANQFITLENNNRVGLNFGYPLGNTVIGTNAALGGIMTALDVSGFNTTAANGVVTFTSQNDTNCTFTYTQSAAAGAAPVIGALAGC